MRIAVVLGTAAILTAAAGDSWIEALQGTAARNAKGEITALSFRSTWITDSDLKPIAAMPALRSLDLSHTRITDIGFQQLKSVANVEDVNLYYAEQIGDGALVVMKDWKKLRRLNLRGAKVTDLGIAQLAGHPSLEAIDVGYSLFTDNGFEPMTAIPNLKEIAAGGNKLTDVGVNMLRLLPGLTRVDLAGAQRTDSGLWAATITDRGLETLSQLKNLRTLNLRASKITDAGMNRFAALTALVNLDIAQTNVSPAGLRHLAGLANIEQLSLWKCARVDDAAVAVLSEMKSLKWLDIEGAAITAAGEASIQQALPGVKIAR